MTDSQDVVKGPLCEGHGELRRAELVERLSDGEFKSKVDSALGELVQSEEELAAARAVGRGNEFRDFQKDVHSWNPQLPMWRRSPKE
jgi:hypothetical protein